MRIPSKDMVKYIIKETLRNQNVHSQQELAELVNRKLRVGDQSYSVSQRRAKMLALEMPEVSVKVRTRKGPVPEKCPSCKSDLRKIYTKNLEGRKLLLKMECPMCSYTGKGEKWVPMRYDFNLIS
jgi:hypothetical protein